MCLVRLLERCRVDGIDSRADDVGRVVVDPLQQGLEPPDVALNVRIEEGEYGPLSHLGPDQSCPDEPFSLGQADHLNLG